MCQKYFICAWAWESYFSQTLNQSKTLSQPLNNSIQNSKMITTFLAFLHGFLRIIIIMEVTFIFSVMGFDTMMSLLPSLEVYFNPEVEDEVTNEIPNRGPGRWICPENKSCLSGCSEVFKQLFSNLGWGGNGSKTNLTTVNKVLQVLGKIWNCQIFSNYEDVLG